jgi:hypothetical protein
MNTLKTLTIVVLATSLMTVVPTGARADRWYNSKGAWATYGFVGGALVGHLVTREFGRPRYPQPVYGGGGYYGQPGYAAPQDTYTIYKEDRIWPFYRRVRAESIPMIQPPPPGRSAARSLANDDVPQPTTTVVNNYYYGNDAKPGDAPPAKTTEESIEGARRDSKRPLRMEVITVSNRAGETQIAEVKIRERKLEISQRELDNARTAARDLQTQVDELIDSIGKAEQQVQEELDGMQNEVEVDPSVRVEATI